MNEKPKKNILENNTMNKSIKREIKKITKVWFKKEIQLG